jgi:hypothetical protein
MSNLKTIFVLWFVCKCVSDKIYSFNVLTASIKRAAYYSGYDGRCMWVLAISLMRLAKPSFCKVEKDVTMVYKSTN